MELVSIYRTFRYVYRATRVYGSHDVRNLQSSFAIVYHANYYLYNALHNPVLSYIYIYILCLLSGANVITYYDIP